MANDLDRQIFSGIAPQRSQVPVPPFPPLVELIRLAYSMNRPVVSAALEDLQRNIEAWRRSIAVVTEENEAIRNLFAAVQNPVPRIEPLNRIINTGNADTDLVIANLMARVAQLEAIVVKLGVLA